MFAVNRFVVGPNDTVSDSAQNHEYELAERPVGSLGDSYQKTLQRPLSLWGDCPTVSPYGSATARNCGNVQVIVQKDHRMRLSFLREQLVRSSEQLVLVDTNKGFLGPVTRSNAQPLCDS